MTGTLADKSIIITGAGSGIGEAAARLFANAGARLVLANRNGERGEALRHRHGPHRRWRVHPDLT
ncbi:MULTISPECIES: SDR family NAD(P)-dependent oxidoreductase [Xanthobacter]|uniref:SDR family NAD(P)-dependent oxidoreductase n=1 Tax=Xanthobacter TaxID=279 RepID=UPI002022E955|nr:SDR family NAD(P)-dependent oxidoreductase [Xanthobacter aminoxidans]MCL8382891.1 SDR family NAD(P)-dependent oxidoreductase [Xanthobacter aminoxidans]